MQMRPGVFVRVSGEAAKQRGEGLRDDQLSGDVDLELLPERCDVDVEQGAGIGDAGIVDEAEERLALELRFYLAGRRLPTAASSVTSNMSGVKAAPNSALRRSASTFFRTLPNTWKPFAVRTFTQPQPIPVEAPVTTMDFIQVSPVRPAMEGAAVGCAY